MGIPRSNEYYYCQVTGVQRKDHEYYYYILIWEGVSSTMIIMESIVNPQPDAAT